MEKTVSSGDWSYRNKKSLTTIHRFVIFENFKNSRILKKRESNQQLHYFST